MTRVEEIQHGTVKHVELKKGDRVKIWTPDGHQGGDLSFPGFDQSLTRNINGWERFGRPKLIFAADPGTKLYDGDGQAVFEMGDATPGLWSDIMYPGCWSELYPDGRPGCRDLLAQALGVSRRSLPGVLSFFAYIEEIDREGYGFGPMKTKPGDFISLIALIDTQLAITACPDDTIEGVIPSYVIVQVSGE